MKKFSGKSVMVTGACGTIGSELVRQLMMSSNFEVGELICVDNNESALFFMDQLYASDDRARFFVADIRDQGALIELMRGVDIVFHSAALKHVVLCERSPDQAVQTNIGGVENIIAAANASGVQTVIFTSSDKAVNPTNVMGTSKLMGERLMTAANSNRRRGGPIFASTRFGNVLGSNGSVIPIFRQQIAKGGPVTLTDRRMSRFVMTVAEAVELVIDSAELVRGGEVFVTKMPTLMIEDLAKVMIEVLAPRFGFSPDDINIVEIGAKPGEKLYEELISSEETRRTLELDRYFSVLPAFRGSKDKANYAYPRAHRIEMEDAYKSEGLVPLDESAIRELLTSNGLLG